MWNYVVIKIFLVFFPKCFFCVQKQSRAWQVLAPTLAWYFTGKECFISPAFHHL